MLFAVLASRYIGARSLRLNHSARCHLKVTKPHYAYNVMGIMMLGGTWQHI